MVHIMEQIVYCLAQTLTVTTAPLPGGTVTVEAQIADSFANQLLVQPMATLRLSGEPPKVNHVVCLPAITPQE